MPTLRSPLVGLDIGSTAVKAVVLRRSRGGWSLAAAGEVTIAAESVVGGQGADPVAVSGAVRQALEGLGMRRARVAAALAGHVIVKRLSLPAMNRGELAETISWEVEQYIPFDLADVQIDYQVLNGGKGTSTLDVLLVAARKDRIEDRAAIIAQAGRRAAVMDVEAFALVNAYQMNYPDRADSLVALLHVGRSTTIACLLEHGQLAFTRDISIGGRLYTETLQRELGVDAGTAERLQHGPAPPEISREQVASLLREASGQVILEVRKTIDFYRATAPDEALSRIVLSGGAWESGGLVDLMAEEFGAPVEALDPFRRVARSKRGPEVSGPAYALAVGLAMRREGDR